MTLSRATPYHSGPAPGGSTLRGPLGRHLLGCVAVLACLALILFGPYAASGHSAVFLADGIAVWIDVRGTPDALARHTSDIEASVATLTIGRR